MKNIINSTFVAVASLSLAACFNTGSLESTVTETPVFTLKVEVIDAASGLPITDAVIEVTDDAVGVVSSGLKSGAPVFSTTNTSGIAEFLLDDSLVSDENADGRPDDIPNVSFKVTKTRPGKPDEAEIISTVSIIQLLSLGNNSVVVAVTNVDEPPAGVSVMQQTFTPANISAESICDRQTDLECAGPVDEDGDGAVDEFVFRAEADASQVGDNVSTAEVELALPAEAVLTTSDGVELDVEDGLMVVVTAYDAANPESLAVFPGGFSAQVSNVSDLATDLPTSDLDGDPTTDDSLAVDDISETVAMQSAGFAAVEIRDSKGQIAANVSGQDAAGLPLSARVRINVSPDALNPETDELVKAGDKIPVWSLNEGTGEWQYESIREILQDGDGGLYTQFETTHFSYFNMDWFRRGPDGVSCSPRINLVDRNNRRLSTRGYITISGTNSRGAGYTKRDHYRGEGYMTFHNSPSVPLSLAFFAENSAQAIKIDKLVGVDGDISADGTTLDNVKLCSSAGGTVVARVVNETPKPTMRVNGPYRVEEGEAGVYTATLSTAAAEVATFTVAIDTRGSANPDSDFSSTDQTISIPVGSRSTTFEIATTNDTLVEPLEDIRFAISPIAGIKGDPDLLNERRLFIYDDDKPTLSVSSVTASEADGSAIVQVTLTPPPLINTYVRVATVPNTALANVDYRQKSVNLFFGPDSSVAQVSKSVNLELINDASREIADETFTVRASAYQFAVTNVRGVAEGVVTIQDDGDSQTDNASEITVSIDVDEEILEGRYYRGYPVFLTLNQGFSSELVVRLNSESGTATQGNDFDHIDNRAVTFAPGVTRVLAGSLAIRGDSLQEEDETVRLVVGNPSVAGVSFAPQTTVTIKDDDTAQLRASMRYQYESAGNAILTLSLDRAASRELTATVEFETSPYRAATAGEDFTVNESLLTQTFAPGETQKTIVIPLIDDNVAEGYEYIRGTVSGIGRDSIFSGAIIDNDRITLSIADATVTEGGVLTFRVSVDGAEIPASSNLRVLARTENLSALAGSDYTAFTADAIQIQPGDSELVIEVPTLDDVVAEPTEELYLGISVSGLSGVYVVDRLAVGTIIDNDGQPSQTGTGGGSNGGQTGGGGDGI